MTITVLYSFCAGHRLLGYPGRCAHVHGHNYKLEVVLTGPVDDMGFVADFSTVKERVKTVVDKFDHAFIANWTDDFCEWLGVNMQRRVVMNRNPSAENIAQVIFNELQKLLAEWPTEGLLSVTLWETPSNFATVSAWSIGPCITEVYPCSSQ